MTRWYPLLFKSVYVPVCWGGDKSNFLGWQPQITLDEGIARTVKEYLNGNGKR